METYKVICYIVSILLIIELLLFYSMYKFLYLAGHRPKFFYIPGEFIKLWKENKSRQLTMVLILYYLDLSAIFFLSICYWCNWFDWFS